MRGIQVQYLQEENAKLGGVVLYGDIHPTCNVQSVTPPVRIDGRRQLARRNAFTIENLKTGDKTCKQGGVVDIIIVS